MPILTKAAAPVKGTATLFTLDKAALAAVTSVAADAYFSDSAKWEFVSLIYNSSVGNQYEIVKFDATKISPTSKFSVSARARDVFQIQKIVIKDFDGGTFEVLRSELATAESEFDVDVSAPAGPSVPGQPLNLLVSQIGSAAVLTWEAPLGTVTGYDVYKSSNGGATFTKEGDAVLGISFEDNSVSFDSGYQYYVVAKNNEGDSVASDTTTITIYDVPTMPINVSVIQTSAGVNYFSWDAPQGPVDGYHVYASYDGGNNYNILPDTTDTFYSDSVDPSSSATFFYQVNAFNFLGDGALTSPISIEMVPEASAPSAVWAYLELDGISIRVDWTGEDNILYRIYRSFDGGVFSQVHETTSTNRSNSLGTSHTWLDNSTLAAGSYVYRIYGLSWSAESEFFLDTSSSVEVAAALAAPTNLDIINSGSPVVQVNFDLVIGATSYNVYASDNGGIDYYLLENTTFSGASMQTSVIEGSPEIIYFYVKAFDGSAESDPSNIVSLLVGE